MASSKTSLEQNLPIFLIAEASGEEESFEELLHEDPNRVNCILGIQGVGKTRLLKSAVDKWTAQYRFLHFDMRERGHDPDTVCKDSVVTDRTELVAALEDYSPHSYSKIEIAEILKSEGKGTVIIMDHLDDFDKSDPSMTVFLKMLSGKLLPEARIIMAAQFPSQNTTHELIRGPCSYHILEGIKQGSEIEFLEAIRPQFKDDRLYENLKYHCPELCHVPGMVEELLATFKDKPQTATTGSTKLIEPLVIRLINQYIRKHSLDENEPKTLNSLSDTLKIQLSLVGKLAYQFVGNSMDSCCYSDLHRFITLSGGVDELGIGWLFLAKTVDRSGVKAYKFGNLTVQEFLAAYYLATEPLLDQIRLLMENMDFIFTNRRLRNVIRFYYGIGCILSKEIKASNEIVPEAVWTRKPILESIIGNQLHIDEELDTKREKLLYIFQLLQESEDRNLARKFLSRREKYLELSLGSPLQLSEPLVTNIAFVMSNSGISKWIIEASESAVHSAHFIEMLVQQETARRVEVRINIIHNAVGSEAFTIRPLVGSGVQLGETLPQSAYARCMREVLHRFLQLYSPIRLKSNCSDASYVSFLSCSCLRDEVEARQVLVLESINAVHWITVKETKRKSASLDTDLHHHMATHHNMEHLELVFMLSPLPNRILYKTPSGGDKMQSIELFRATAPSSLDGRIATSLQQHLRCDDKVANQRDIATETETMVGSLPPEFVTHPFIIPLNFKDVAKKVVMNSHLDHTQKTTPVASANIEEPHFSADVRIAIQSTESPAAPHPCTSDSISNQSSPPTNVRPMPRSMYSQQSSQHVSSNPRLSSQPFISQQSIQQSQLVGAPKQLAVPPGTVLHTVNPEVFTLNTIYNLPDENNLLKRGGNGTVFAVSYGRMEYAVKRTPFRNREFQIHKKLRHPNIIELSCFMFGPPQPQFKRRFYSYHFMPRVTGDLSRMVTDRCDLVMTALSTKYGNDPLRLSSIQANMKFILKEMLKGLSYMHLLKIAHRDIKASNILIDMKCSCDNPLTCICNQKCLVTIADFDAAIQLDASGFLQATPHSSHHKKFKSTYQIIPVGTEGYRSPELSQHTVSSDLSALTPSLGVKTDVWSVGMIVMRMLNGSNGPARQHKLSTLLLYYEQEKFNERKQRPKPPKFMKVSEREVDKILGIHKLKEMSNSWIQRAVDFISRCLEVDPDKRPEAEDLLKDSFLY